MILVPSGYDLSMPYFILFKLMYLIYINSGIYYLSHSVNYSLALIISPLSHYSLWVVLFYVLCTTQWGEKDERVKSTDTINKNGTCFIYSFCLFFAPGFGRQPPLAVSDILSMQSFQKDIKPLHCIASTSIPNSKSSRWGHSSTKHQIKYYSELN